MTSLYRLCRPALFTLPPESAHRLTHTIGETIDRRWIRALLARHFVVSDDRLRLERFGRTFPNPVGVAAGFDKNARIPTLLGALGFGHVEVGGITARPQQGNPRPRLFRLATDEALVNRMGFNNAGADRIAAHLDERPATSVPLGINLGASKGVPAEFVPDDYLYTFERLRGHGAFFVINVSSPNTPGLRELQQRDRLERIVGTLQDAGAAPLLVKVSPDLHREALLDICDVVDGYGLDGIVATNTTVERDRVQSPNAAEPGGLSGAPLADRSTEVIRTLAAHTEVPIVGVGGIFTPADAYEKIRAGASLVQLYTGLIYRGPGIARELNRGLLRLLERDGYDSVEEAIGSAAD